VKPSSHLSQVYGHLIGSQEQNPQESDMSLSLNVAGYPIRLLIQTTEEQQIVLSCTNGTAQNGLPDHLAQESLSDLFPVELLFSPEVLALIFRLIVLHSTMDVATQDRQSQETNGSQPSEATNVANYPTKCHGTHEGPCTGDLWICPGCGKGVCQVERTGAEPQLCHQCWDRQYTLAMMPDAQEGETPASEAIVISCDCIENGGECGTWLELSPDGILAVEDKDGERVSIMLPNWLDHAMRHAFSQQPAVENE
jgi:hypothetical protein